MMIRGTIGVLVLVSALLACSGCVQTDTSMVQIPATSGVNTPSAPAPVLSLAPAGQSSSIPAPVASTATTVPAGQTSSPVVPAGNPESGGFVRYSGAGYSIDYPASWSVNSTILPLREYRHAGYECTVMFAYNLDQDLRMFTSRDGSTLFYSSVVTTQRDIWPRTVPEGGQVVYEDIVNAVLGNPENCANYPGNEAFTIAGISQVPLGGVPYTGVRADFARINASGFAHGTGTAYVVTGKDHRGVFTIYSTSMDADSRARLADALFGSLRLDPGF